MKLLLTTLAIVYLSLFMSLQAQEQVRVIPYPAEVTMQAETCKLKSGQKIHYLDASLFLSPRPLSFYKEGVVPFKIKTSTPNYGKLHIRISYTLNC